MNLSHIHPDDPIYPSSLTTHLGSRAPTTVAALGDLGILRQKRLALFSSFKCPGNLVLQSYDLAQRLRAASVAVIGGFHSPMERECLMVLLRGPAPVVLCPARGIEGMRLPEEYRRPLEEGRLLLISPFAEKQRRADAEMALYRNQVVAALADHIFVAHAEPFSKTEQFCREIINWGKLVYTLEDDANTNLIALGAKPLRPASIVERA